MGFRAFPKIFAANLRAMRFLGPLYRAIVSPEQVKGTSIIERRLSEQVFSGEELFF